VTASLPTEPIGSIPQELLAAKEALAEETRVLEILNRTGASIAAELDLQSLVQRVTDAATQLSGARFGAFFYNVVGAQGEACKRFGLPPDTPLFDRTFRGEGVLRSDDITRDPRSHQGMPKSQLPVCSYLAVPVISRSKEVIGGLFLGHPEPGVFAERAERLVSGVAAQAAIAIDNARLYEAAQSARLHAERMGELKDEFLSTLSHELRTPISAILGWSQVVRSRKMSDAELRRAIEVIERNARAQVRLIEDLLDMARITSGQLRLDLQHVEPAPLLEAALETVRPSAEAKDIRLTKVLDAQAGAVSGDPGRLQQVAWNLLSNAIKFTPKGGEVHVRLQRERSHLRFSVSDTGIGIGSAFLPHLFDRFRQADASTTRRQGGLGIGLAIARHLAQLHGGTLSAQSDGEGRGATFTVELPLADAPASRAAGTRARAADRRAADLSGLRVLAVDDHADARELVRQVLEDCGARVTTAGSAAEALALAARERPDVLVSDIGMPDSGGYDLLSQLRALGGAEIPAIALTAFARSEDRSRVLDAGFRAHIAKPVEPAALIDTVTEVTGRGRD
jgi:signal transduction histidine kinase